MDYITLFSSPRFKIVAFSRKRINFEATVLDTGFHELW